MSGISIVISLIIGIVPKVIAIIVLCVVKDKTQSNLKAFAAFAVIMAITIFLDIYVINFTKLHNPANLEQLVNSDEEFAAEIESYETSGMTIDVTENTLTYTYKYDQTFDESTAALMTSELEKAMSSMDSTFEGVKDTLIEETGFSDIVVKIVYTDGSDAVLYEKSY